MASQIVKQLARSRASGLFASSNRSLSSESSPIHATLFPGDGIGPEIAESVKQFDGTDYGFWKMQIEDYLYATKLHQPLKTKPEGMDEIEWARLDRRVLGLIRLTLLKSVFLNVATETTTAGMMKALSDLYKIPSVNKKILLLKKLFHLKMDEGASVAAHLGEFHKIVNQLSTAEIKFNDEVLALILLESLPNSWESVKTAICCYVGNEKLKFTDVRDRILAEEVWRIDFRDTSSSSPLDVKSRVINQDNPKLKPFKCWNCGKTGHIKKNCRSLSKTNDKKGCGANTVEEEIAYALSCV